MTRRVQVRFLEFDTTSEVGGLDGSTYVVVTVAFTLDEGAGPVHATASVGISTAHGRRSYEILDETFARREPLARAIVAYVKEAERVFRSPALVRDHRSLEKVIELDL